MCLVTGHYIFKKLRWRYLRKIHVIVRYSIRDLCASFKRLVSRSCIDPCVDQKLQLLRKSMGSWNMDSRLVTASVWSASYCCLGHQGIHRLQWRSRLNIARVRERKTTHVLRVWSIVLIQDRLWSSTFVSLSYSPQTISARSPEKPPT